MKERDGYHTSGRVLVNRNIRIDTETDEAIRLMSERQGKPFGTVARELLVKALGMEARR